MYSQTKIAIPIFKKDKESILEEVDIARIRGADLIEFRIDGMENPNEDIVCDIIKEIPLPVIATNRINTEGGSFNGSEEERIALLNEAAKVADYVDIELQSDLKYIKEVTSHKSKSIISFHDFNKTPPLETLLDIVKKEKSLGDIAKIALMPNSLEDTITVLTVLSHCEDTIAISMDELGSYTRIIASKFDAPITFAATTTSTAPGQIDIETMKLLIHNDSILDFDVLGDLDE